MAEVARIWAGRYGCGEIATPIFEFTEVFQRTLGETSDVVTKEMYTFEDRGGDRVTLRPEYTAGIIRAVISGGLANQLPLRYFAAGPVFRYERPQKGRLRQFHQIDVEFLGSANPSVDVEVIALAADILDALGIRGKTTLEINSLGDAASRAAYRKCLVDYFTEHRDALSEDGQIRLVRNPLRILDSKDEGDRALIAGAPLMTDSLNAESAAFFTDVCAGLERLGVSFSVNQRLVRGLDYYTHTAFEFSTSALGAQGAIIAGGRYDDLAEAMGGPPMPGIGWAGGIERLALLLEVLPTAPRPIALVPVGAAGEDQAVALAHQLRRAGFAIELGFSGNLKNRMKRADKIGARAAILFGEDELSRGVVTIRDLDSGEQCEVGLDDLTTDLARFRG